MHFRTLYCKRKIYLMARDVIIFNNFLKQFGIHREFYRELRLAQSNFLQIENGKIEFPDDCSPEDYIIHFFNWNRTRRGSYFWSLMDDVWRDYYSKNL